MDETICYVIEPVEGGLWHVVEKQSGDVWCLCIKKERAATIAKLLNTSVQTRALQWRRILPHIIPTPFTGAAKA